MKSYNRHNFKYAQLYTDYISKNWNHFLDNCATVLNSRHINPDELLLTLDLINTSLHFTIEYIKNNKPLTDKDVCPSYPIIQVTVNKNKISHFA